MTPAPPARDKSDDEVDSEGQGVMGEERREGPVSVVPMRGFFNLGICCTGFAMLFFLSLLLFLLLFLVALFFVLASALDAELCEVLAVLLVPLSPAHALTK